MSVVSVALRHARDGDPVFRIRRGTKDKPQADWANGGATVNPADAFDNFAGQAVNIGIRTDRLIVVDVDGHREGFTTIARHPELPSTYTVRTPNGGLHLYYRAPAGASFSGGVNRLGHGVDVKAGPRNYVVGAGSSFNDKEYMLEGDTAIIEAPAWLCEHLGTARERSVDAPKTLGEIDTLASIESARAYLDRSAPLAVEGAGGNETSYRVACAVKDRGVSPETALELMLEHWNSRCSPEWEPDDLETIIRNAYQYGQAAIGRDNPAAGFTPIDLPPAELDDVETFLERPSDITREGILAASARDILKGMIAPGMGATLYGETGVGKSHIALDLAFHIAHGLDYHGLRTRKVPILYIQLEGVAGFRKRILASCEKFGDPGAFFVRLKVPVSLAKDAAGLKGADLVIRAVKHLKAKTGSDSALVIIDTKARATAGDNENDGADMSSFSEKRQGYIARETDACVLTVHHAGKAGDYRGHTSQKAADDLVLKVERGRVTAEKVKDGVDGPFFSFALQQVQLGSDADGTAVTTCVVAKSPAKLDAAANGRPATKRKEVTTFLAAFQKVAREQAHPETCEAIDGAMADVVRQEFFASYPAGETNPKAAQATKRKAWGRAIRELLPPEFKVRTFGGAELIWCEKTEW